MIYALRLRGDEFPRAKDPMSSDSSSASRRPPDVVRRPLDGFIEAASRAGGIGVIELDALTTLVVRTANSVYRITVLKPYACTAPSSLDTG